MIKLSAYSLTTLRIIDVGTDDPHALSAELKELLQTNSVLRELLWSLTRPHDVDPIFRMLTLEDDGGGNVCPLLEHLDIENVRFSAEPLLDMLESRIRRSTVDSAQGLESGCLDFLRVTNFHTHSNRRDNPDSSTKLCDTFNEQETQRRKELTQSMLRVTVLDWHKGIVDSCS